MNLANHIRFCRHKSWPKFIRIPSRWRIPSLQVQIYCFEKLRERFACLYLMHFNFDDLFVTLWKECITSTFRFTTVSTDSGSSWIWHQYFCFHPCGILLTFSFHFFKTHPYKKDDSYVWTERHFTSTLSEMALTWHSYILTQITQKKKDTANILIKLKGTCNHNPFV